MELKLIHLKKLNTKLFNKVKMHKKLTKSKKFMTLYIETINNDNGVIIPYLICGYSDAGYIASTAKDTSKESVRDKFNEFIIQLTRTDKSIKYVYAHNFSQFLWCIITKISY